MLDLWLQGIETLITGCPGGTDPVTSEAWSSTITRLGVATQAAARNKCFWDYLETEDAAEDRPFFVLREYDSPNWYEFDLEHLAAVGGIEVAYTEPSLVSAADHKAAKRHFIAWTSRLIEYCAEQRRAAVSGSYEVPICAIETLVEATRAPRAQRDEDRPGTDYWWAAWLFVIGERKGAYR